MDANFWHRRWQLREIGFHKDEVHHFLQQFLPRLNLPKVAGVLVPLCGKSHDLLWLCEQGYQVIGVELSQQAVEEFFRENRLQPTISKVDGFSCYQFDRLTIYCGDFFSLTEQQTGPVAAIYDRGSLVALPPTMRQDYVRHLRQLLKPGCRMLTISYEFNQQQRPGPPFSVPQAELDKLFGDWCTIEKLHSESTLEKHQMLKAAGVEALNEEVYRICVD
jgi:thiopurine S-methyltransferase